MWSVLKLTIYGRIYVEEMDKNIFVEKVKKLAIFLFFVCIKNVKTIPFLCRKLRLFFFSFLKIWPGVLNLTECCP